MLQKLRLNKRFLRILISRTEHKRDAKMRACAPNFIALARAARSSAQQNIFAQFTAREGAEGSESIKKERISAK
jgi:hypothetical protein